MRRREELVTAALNVDDDPRHLVYLIASNLRMEAEERQELLETDPASAKLRELKISDRSLVFNTDLVEALEYLDSCQHCAPVYQPRECRSCEHQGHERGVAPELHVAEPRFWRYPNQSRVLGILSAGTGRISPHKLSMRSP